MTRTRAIWTDHCDTILLDVLFKERQGGRQADNASWHTSVWTTAETALAGTEAHTGGTAKTAQSCQTRWGTLKKDYKEVKQIRELSGFGWDTDKHLAIAADDIWENYIEAHPKAKKWRKTSFPHFDDIACLIEGSYATGSGVFRSGEPPSDISDDEDNSANPSSSPITWGASTPSDEIKSRSLFDISNITPSPSVSSATSSNGKRIRSHRKTSSQAIEGMVSSIGQLANAFIADAQQSQAAIPSPARKRSAIHAIEDDGDLSDNEQIRAFKIIRRDTGFADTILAIRKKAARTRFIKAELYGDASED